MRITTLVGKFYICTRLWHLGSKVHQHIWTNIVNKYLNLIKLVTLYGLYLQFTGTLLHKT